MEGKKEKERSDRRRFEELTKLRMGTNGFLGYYYHKS
jgi:hypothetical protein